MLTKVLFLLSGTEDFFKEAYKQFDDREVIDTIMKAFEKIRFRSDLLSGTHNYFLVKDPKFRRFYLLANIYTRLHDVLGRSVISNYGFYTKNISSFLDFNFQPPAQRVKSYKGRLPFFK